MRILFTLLFILISTASVADEVICEHLIDQELKHLTTITESGGASIKEAQDKIDSLKEKSETMSACEILISDPTIGKTP